MYKKFNRSLFWGYKIENNFDFVDFGVRFDMFLNVLVKTKNSEIGLDHLGEDIIDNMFPFLKYYLNKKLGDGKTIKYYLEKCFVDFKNKNFTHYGFNEYNTEGLFSNLESKSFNFKYSIRNTLIEYNKSIDFDFDFNLQKYNLDNDFDLSIVTIQVENLIKSSMCNTILYRQYIRELVLGVINNEDTSLEGEQIKWKERSYLKYFTDFKGIWETNKPLEEVNKPTFQFKQQVKWGVITKSEYNDFMLIMYGIHFKSFLRGCVDLLDYPKQIEDYLIDDIDNEVNRELYYSLIFGMVNRKNGFNKTFLYKNIKGDNKPNLYLGIFKLIEQNKIDI